MTSACVRTDTDACSQETAVLPLLREEQGSGISTVEERVIGAGLKALEKHEDGAAVKELFHVSRFPVCLK